MEYTWIQLVAFFFLYAFVGWSGELIFAAIRAKRFVNRGFINGPICPIYGIVAVIIAIFLPELKDNTVILFLGGMVIATVFEYVTGRWMERIFHRKLWDYSGSRFHLDGYICLPYSLLWGALAVLSLVVINPLVVKLLGLIPHPVKVIGEVVLIVCFTLDLLTTVMTVMEMQIRAKRLAQFPQKMQHTSKWLENILTTGVEKRMKRSFPTIDLQDMAKEWEERRIQRETSKEKFAEGCGFYKLISLFFIGAFLGDITETIYCYLCTGILMSRSSVVYGPFSIVWGIGCSLISFLLYRYKDKSDRYIFVAGMLLGGAYEYICSVFTELVFGTVFWDYSGFAFNIGGRINLLYCFFWGIAAVVWMKAIYPFLSKYIEKLPKKSATIVCNVLIIFMVINVIISSFALARYEKRNTMPDYVAESALEEQINNILDEHFPDGRMERIYPNAKIVE